MEDSESSPFLVVVAGPNGSGKTTITDRFREAGIDLGQYINADEITLELLKDTSSPTPQNIFNSNRKAANRFYLFPSAVWDVLYIHVACESHKDYEQDA